MEMILTGLSVLVLYKLFHDFMLNSMSEAAKKPLEKEESLPSKSST
jgi:hypothetical protein